MAKIQTSELAPSEYLDMYESAPDMYISTDAATGVILQCNATLANVTGFAKEEIVGRQIIDIFDSNCASEIRDAFEQCGTHDREFILLRKDGSRLDISLSVATLQGQNGGSRQCRATLRDISERKRIEDSLRFIAQRGWVGHAEDFLTALATYLGKTFAVDYVIIDRIATDDPGTAETVALYAKGAILPSMRYSLANTPCENVIGKVLCYYPRKVQALFPADILLTQMGVESYAGVPLWDSEGRALGLIAVMDSKPFREGTTLTNILQLVATSAAAALERELTEKNLRLNLAHQKALLEVYQEMPTASVPKIISLVVEKCVGITESTAGFVGLVSDGDQVMEAHVWSEKGIKNPVDKPLMFPLKDAGLWAEPVRQARVMIANDFHKRNHLEKDFPEGQVEIGNFMGVPVIDSGRVVALAGVANKRGKYCEADQYQMSLLLKGMWEIIKRKRAEEELRRLNEQLEARVQQRTAELEKLNKLFVGRELKMIELKKQINELEKQCSK